MSMMDIDMDEMGIPGIVPQMHLEKPLRPLMDPQEDMDLIESLWRQDIDMGVCPDTYPYKADISKPGFTEELKKQGIDFWDYSIDGETGEYVPGPHQDLASVGEPPQPVLPQVPVPQTQTQPLPLPLPQPQPQPQPDTQLVQQESSLSLEDCLHLLETELSPDAAQTELSPSLSHQEVEQRWQDIATLPELQGNIAELVPDAMFNATQDGFVAPQQHFGQGMTNGSSSLVPDITELQQPQVPSNVFAVNATTNGMVSLQNATRPPQHQQQQQSLLLTPPHNDTFQNFSNLNINPLNHTANGVVAISNSNATGDYLMQTLQQQMNSVNTTTPFTAANLSLADNSSSLLMDLLNSPGSPNPINPMDLNFDEQMHDVLAALADDAESLSDEEDSEGSIFNDSEEGAAGYSSGSDQDSSKGATGGYHYARGHEKQYGSDSSSSSSGYSGQPPKMENIRHNHSYSSPSQSQMQNGNGAQNGSYNANKLGRDEKRAKQLKLPVGVEKIVNLPVDSFNDLVKKFDLNDAQMQLVRDIRRRGKNKVAAQNCRKRKIDAIMMVETVVSELRSERDKLARERDSIDKEVSEMQARYSELCEEVFSSIQDEHGGPVDPNDFMLQQLPDGTVYLIPRNGNSTTHRDREEPSM